VNVYFSANHRNINNDLNTYREIIRTIQLSNLELVNNWIEVVGNETPPYENSLKWVDVCHDARVGIDAADIIVAEASGASSFGSGFEVGCALSMNKQIILLISADKINDSYAGGLDRQAVIIIEYEQSTLSSQLFEALKKVMK
jgi:hypothetical protein